MRNSFKNIIIISFSVSSFILFFLCLFVSLKNPGFYKAINIDQDKLKEMMSSDKYIKRYNFIKYNIIYCYLI